MVWTFQSNMSRGELDPELVGRVDLDAYYNGLKTAENVVLVPQGGVKRRPGTRFLYELLGEARLETFKFSETDSFVLAFTDERVQFFRNGVLVTNINGSGNDYLVTPYDISEVREFDLIQSGDTIIITSPDVAPQALVRVSAVSTWSINPISFLNIPQFDFNDSSSPSGQAQIQQLDFDNVAVGDRYQLSLNGILTDEIVYAGFSSSGDADAAASANAIQEALQTHPSTANTGVTVVPSSTGTNQYVVTFGGDSSGDYDLLTGTPIQVDSTSFRTEATITQAGISQKENVWSATRGWPQTCTFHEGRLYFGGSPSRPSTVWGSNVNDFFNFDAGRGLADQGIDVTLDTDQVNSITGVYSNRSLQVFTSGAEFFAPESPITPENVAFVPQTNFGSRRVRPISINGFTMYVQESGKSINQFLFIDEFQANQSVSLSTFSPHLINSPKQLKIKRGDTETNANYVYIVPGVLDEPFGAVSLTILNTLEEQGIRGFTKWSTESGAFSSVAVDDGLLYMSVRRSANDYYLEVEDSTLSTDSAFYDPNLNSDVVTGLTWLDSLTGPQVQVKGDGVYLGEFTVDPVTSSVTLPVTVQEVEVGYGFAPTIETMPINVQGQGGFNFADRKRIKRAGLQLFESNGVIINGQRISDRTIGQNQFDPPIPQTGLRRIFLGGWSLDASVTITQDTPFFMQLGSLGLEVKT